MNVVEDENRTVDLRAPSLCVAFHLVAGYYHITKLLNPKVAAEQPKCFGPE